jgi:uncharacterized protein (TIGR01244 family)
VTADQIPQLKKQGFATIIAVRPDGEVNGQPTAQEIGSATKENYMHFAYVPVAHGEIPHAAVEALNKAIAGSPSPILLYCFRGRRAARTWALAEASRFGGRDANAIMAAVKWSGMSADDLRTDITERIALRAPRIKTRK